VTVRAFTPPWSAGSRSAGCADEQEAQQPDEQEAAVEGVYSVHQQAAEHHREIAELAVQQRRVWQVRTYERRSGGMSEQKSS
jgi:hypothetical protein